MPIRKKSSGPSIGKPSRRSLELFFMVCYDIDRFCQFVASEGFGDIYDLPTEEIKNILCNDADLMLFGEKSIKLRAESSEIRRGRRTVQRTRLEHEAAERLAHDDGSHGNI